MKKAKVYWLTGLSGSGKTTITERVIASLVKRGRKVTVYDGDKVREKVNRHLGFSPEHIRENNAVIAKMCVDSLGEYDYIFVPVIAPFDDARKYARAVIGDSFSLVYVKASIGEVMRRDPKGLYKRARQGRIKNFIGVDKDVPYQAPDDADIVLDTDVEEPEMSAAKLLRFIEKSV